MIGPGLISLVKHTIVPTILAVLLLWIVIVGLLHSEAWPVWVFLEWLVLLSHLLLLNSHMPANLQAFLEPLLDLTRLTAFTRSGDDQDTELLNYQDGEFVNFASSGYQGSSLLDNLEHIFIFIGVLIVGYAVFKFTRNCQRWRSSGIRVGSFVIRLVYEIFFEILLCTLLQLRLAYDGQKPSTGAIFMLVLCTAFAVFVTIQLIKLRKLHRPTKSYTRMSSKRVD